MQVDREYQIYKYCKIGMLKQGQGHGSFGIDAIRKQAQKSRNFVHKVQPLLRRMESDGEIGHGDQEVCP
jgi:hypothetical protein